VSYSSSAEEFQGSDPIVGQYRPTSVEKNNVWHYCISRGLLKFESRVSSIKTRVSSIKNGHIRCFLLNQLKLETLVLILETRVFKLDTRVLILETRYSIERNTHISQKKMHITSRNFGYTSSLQTLAQFLEGIRTTRSSSCDVLRLYYVKICYSCMYCSRLI